MQVLLILSIAIGGGNLQRSSEIFSGRFKRAADRGEGGRRLLRMRAWEAAAYLDILAFFFF